MRKPNGAKRSASSRKRRAKRTVASNKVVTQPWSRKHNRDVQTAGSLGPYESTYDIVMGYGAERSIVVS